MNVDLVIKRLGGPKAVAEMTDLTKGRIYQWITENHIPRAWEKFLRKSRPSAFVEPAAPAARRAPKVPARSRSV